MKRAVFRIGLFLIFGSLVTAICAQADSGEPLRSSDQPIDITAKKFTARNVDGGVEGIFESDVKVSQADMTLYCDRLICLFATRNNPANKGVNRGKRFLTDPQAKREIKSVTATGNVKFEQRDRRATAGRAVYDNAKQTITLTEGPPHFWIGTDEGKAETVIIRVDENRIEFLKPVFTIIPGKLEKEK